MHKPELFMEKEMHKGLQNFNIQRDDLIQTRSPDHVIISKK